MEESLPWTPMNRCGKYDATSFILSGKIHNRTNTQKTNTFKQTVTDISTPCLSACVYSKNKKNQNKILKVRLNSTQKLSNTDTHGVEL